MLVPVEGPLAVIAKLADIDEDAAKALVEISLYETLHEMAENARPILEADMDAFVAKSQKARRALVRSFVEKRMSGEDVEDVVKAAAELTLLETEVSKDTQDNPNTPYWDARQKGGRFAPRDLVAVLSGQGTRKNPYENQGAQWANATASQRLAAGGQILARSNDENIRATGLAAQFIGEVGPEAQKVLGNHIRRTAYRYRGTERKPNAQTIAMVRAADTGAKQLTNDATADVAERQVRNIMATRGTPPPEVGAAFAYVDRGDHLDMSRDQLTLAIRGDVAASELIRHLPTATSAAISHKAGRTAPSIGIMIDADGDVVSEAQGFHGDHYVPFDLKNLKRLSGGQYVRTRNMGGPTSEDIYTGLLSNARQMQVISNSGAFTVEFDPSIRGKKRYNDKAAQMVSRYQELLSAVNSGELVQRPLPLERRQFLRQRANQLTTNQREANDKFKELVQAEIEEQSFLRSDEDIDDEARAKAIEEIESTPDIKGVNRNVDIRAGEIAREMRRERKNNAAKLFQLDGEGYAAALDALQEEFPFYIRSIRHEPLPEFVERRKFHNPKHDAKVRASTGRDAGYVAPNQLTLNTPMKATPPKAAETDATAAAAGGGAGGGAAGGAAPKAAARDTKNDLVRNFPIAQHTKELKLDIEKSPELKEQTQKTLRDGTGHAALIYDAEDEAKGKQGVGGYANADKKTVAFLAKNNTPEKFLSAIKSEEGKEALGIIAEWAEGKPGPNSSTDDFHTAFQNEMKALLSLADLAEPFTTFSGDFKKLPESKDHPKPLAIPEIVALGNKLDNYSTYVQTARDNKQERLAKFIETYRTMDNKSSYSSTKTRIDRLKQDLETLNSGDQDRIDDLMANDPDRFKELKIEKANPGGSDLSQEIRERQTAWAFSHALRLAEENKDILGVYGGGEGKAEAPAQGAETAEKRDLVRKAEDLQALVPLVHPDSPVGRLLHRHLAEV